MADDANKASASAGSATGDNGGSGGAGAATVDLEKYVPKTQYEQLESKLGEQGNELGELRKFYQDIAPLLDKLDEHPDLVEAITAGKLDGKLAKAVLEGKVRIEEAVQVQKAHDEVKKDMGTKNFEKADPAEIAKQVEEKLTEKLEATTNELKGSIAEVEETRALERSLDEFIASTKDYPEYAEKILEWFDKHPEQYDIEVAYSAVKGKTLSEKAAEEDKNRAAEESKSNAANAGGGQGSRTGKTLTAEETIGKFIELSGPRETGNLL